MQFALLPTGYPLDGVTRYTIARDSGLAWGTVRAVLDGTGTLASLDRVRIALGARWSFAPDTVPVAVGVALAGRRRGKGLTQRGIAIRLGVSPQTIVTLETRFRGRIETLRRYLRILGLMDVLALPGSKRLVPDRNEPEADVVFTPQVLAARIVAAFSADISGRVLDPARGDGAFYDALPPTLTKDWCEASEGRDFFDWTTPVDWIITNPPWSIFRPFLGHALRVADNILFLAPLNHYATKARVRIIREAGFAIKRILHVPTPTDWPASGFQLAAVHLARGWEGPCIIAELGEMSAMNGD